MSYQFPVLRSQKNQTTLAAAQNQSRNGSREFHCRGFTENRELGTENYARWAPLGNHQLATVCLFQLHRFIQRDDGALNLAVIRRLGRNPLQPQSWRRHQRKKRTAMLGGKANDLIGDAGNEWQQRDANSESGPERMHRNRHIHDHRDDHHRHQEARSTPRMIRRILLYRRGFERIAIFERKYRLVLGPVVLLPPPNFLPQRNAPHKQQKHRDPDQPVHQVEHDLLPENRIHLFQFRRGQQRQVLVHEDEEGDGESHIHSHHPARDFQFLALIVLALIGGNLVQCRIGGKLQRAESQLHRVPQRYHPTHHRPAHPLMLLGRPLQRLAVRDDLARRLAHRDAPGMRRTHPHGLQQRLPADERFLPALQRREQLHRRQKTQDLPPTSHRHWMLLRGRTTPALRVPQI